MPQTMVGVGARLLGAIVDTGLLNNFILGILSVTKVFFRWSPKYKNSHQQATFSM